MPDGKLDNPRIRHRDGAPSFWAYLDGPGRTSAGDAGDVPDLTGNVPAGERSGDCTWADGPWGRCLALSGGRADTNFPVAGLLDFTAIARYRADTNAATARMLDSSYSSGFWIGRSLTSATAMSGGIRHTGFPYGLELDLGDDFPGWHTIAMSRRGEVQTVAVDGGRWSVSGPCAADALSGPPLRIGQDDGGLAPFLGSVDRVEVYPRALSAAEVAREFADPDWRLRPRRSIAAAVVPLLPDGPTFRSFRVRRAGVLGSGTF